MPIGQFNANWFKDALNGQLKRVDAGPNAVHIPAALRSAEPPYTWFEQLVAENRRKDGRWENPSNARNEVTDLMVMTDVVRRLHQPARLDWTRPPLWAAEWDTNALIVPLTGAVIARPSDDAGTRASTAGAPDPPAAGDSPPAPARRNRLDRIASLLGR